MKNLSLIFGIIAILCMLFGLYELLSLSDLNGTLTFSLFMGGFLSSTLFLITDKLSDEKIKKLLFYCWINREITIVIIAIILLSILVSYSVNYLIGTL